MRTGRRLASLLVVLALIGAPAVVLRTFCAGNSCEQAEARTASVPFCSLDARTRELVAAGFYSDRSPDALGVTGATQVVTDVGHGLRVPWPSAEPPGPAAYRLTVPLVFFGGGIRPGTQVPERGLQLDQVAPTLEPLLGFRRPHPEVRTGRAIEGATVPGATTPLAVMIVWKGVGMDEVRAAHPPYLEDLLASDGGADALRVGAGGLATPGSLPFDPAAVLTTIGSGGLPSQHGITGTFLRGDTGVARTFGRGAPSPVIAALGDDLDRATGGKSKIALVGTDVSDRGLIGGTWYGNTDDDTVFTDGKHAAAHVDALLADGSGADGVPDLLGVVLGGGMTEMDRETRAIVAEISAAVPGATFVVTATGTLAAGADPVVAAADLMPVVETTVTTEASVLAATPGTAGLFLDRTAAVELGVSTQQVVDAMKARAAHDGSPLFADAFPSFAVQFGRYC